MKLDANKKTLIIVSCSVIIIAMIFISAFFPLLAKIRLDRQQLSSIESNLSEVESRIDVVKGINEEKLEQQLKTLESILPRKLQMAGVLKEITNLGVSYNVQFVSILPQKSQKELEETNDVADARGENTSAAEYQRLPIQLELNCEYENLGKFLQAMMLMKNNLITIDDLEIRSEADKLPVLSVNLNIQVYALARKYNGQK